MARYYGIFSSFKAVSRRNAGGILRGSNAERRKKTAIDRRFNLVSTLSKIGGSFPHGGVAVRIPPVTATPAMGPLLKLREPAGE